MRVGIYNPRVGTRAAGGTETFLRKMIPRLDADVTLVTGAGELLDEVAAMDIDVRQVPLTYKEDRHNAVLSGYTPVLGAEVESVTMYRNAGDAGSWGTLAACDVVSTHYYLDNLLVSRRLETPTLFRFPGIKQPSVRWRTMLALDDTDRYVVNSASTAARLHEWYGLDVDGVVYAGVDTDRFEPRSIAADGGDGFTVLFVGRLDDGKGVPDLIDAVARCPTDVRLRIVGDGPRRAEFERHADRQLAADRYTFVGAVEHECLPAEYQDADAFVLPSYHESFGIVVVEALACGCPVIASQIDAIREYVTDGENGLLVPPGDPEAVADAILTYRSNRDLRERVAAAGRETAEQYSWDAQAEHFERIYREVAT